MMPDRCPRCGGRETPDSDQAGFVDLVCQSGHRRAEEAEVPLELSYVKGRPEMAFSPLDMVAPTRTVDPELLERVRKICRERNEAARRIEHDEIVLAG